MHPAFQYCLRSVYGTFKRYPVNATAQQFAELLNVRTFNGAQLNRIKALGFDVEQVADPMARTV